MRIAYSALAIALSLAVSHVSAHSWHVCNDYSIVPTSTSTNANFQESACKGWARNYSLAAAIVPNNVFSGDSGYPVQPGTTLPPCKVTRTPGTPLANYYSARFPMANYTVGSKYMVLWPAKNHGTGVNIPDTNMQLYALCDTTSDPANVAAYKTAANLVIDWKANNGTGFKNCPAADAGIGDGAQCSQNFTLSSDFFSKYAGKTCTFIWHWEFNNAADIYTSCFDANILAAPASSGATGSSTGGLLGSGSSSGAQAGIAIGVIIALFAVVGGVIFVYKKKPEVFARFTNRPTRTAGGPSNVTVTRL
jgi:hypothetical protein